MSPTLYIYSLFLEFPSHLGHHRVLSRVPCAIKQVLTSYLLAAAAVYIYQFQSPNSSHPVSPLVSIHLFSTSESLFLLCR